MKIAVFSTKPYDQEHLDKFNQAKSNQTKHQLTYISQSRPHCIFSYLVKNLFLRFGL